MESASEPKQASLYERLGGEAGVRKLANEILDQNQHNPAIGHYFKEVDMDKLKQRVFEFFSMGLGGPHQYTGKDMAAAHQGLNINDHEFDIGNDDVVKVMADNGIGRDEIDEVVGILNSMRGDVVGK
jgi:truncated hemoglobin YjbI